MCLDLILALGSDFLVKFIVLADIEVFSVLFDDFLGDQFMCDVENLEFCGVLFRGERADDDADFILSLSGRDVSTAGFCIYALDLVGFDLVHDCMGLVVD